MSINAQNLLPEKWLFQTSSINTFEEIVKINTGWKSIETGINWESVGYTDYDGYAWYKTSVIIPTNLKKNALKYGGLELNLGKIDDADKTYFNGELLGKTGEFPPNFINAYDTERKYIINTQKIKWGQQNEIYICVYDGSGNGGMYSKFAELRVQGAIDNVKLKVVFNSPDQIIKENQKAEFALVIKNQLDESFTNNLKINIKSDFGDSIITFNKSIKLDPLGQSISDFDISTLNPGFYIATAYLENSYGIKKEFFRFGVAPEKIISPTDKQQDFTSFWENAKKELSQITPNYKVIKVDSLSNEKVNFYLVEMQSLGNVKIRAWYKVPAKAGKYPAIVHFQGYSGVMSPSGLYPNDDMIAMGLNIRGHGNSKDNFNPGFPGFLLSGLENKDKYAYKGAYMDTRRALEFILSRPEVDTSKIAVEGGSQGGALSLAAAALNNDVVKICIPHVPFLSDFPDYFKIATWPANEFKQYKEAHPEQNWDDIYKTLSYFDLKNLATMIKCPTLMAVGLEDEVCPPHINFASYNQINAPKEYIVYPFSGHGLPQEYHKLKYNWLKKQWKMK